MGRRAAWPAPACRGPRRWPWRWPRSTGAPATMRRGGADWQAPAGTLCPVATAAAPSDRAEALSAGTRLAPGPVAAPLLVLGVLLAAARDLGATIALSGGNWRAAALPEGPALSGPAPARLATLELGPAAGAAPGPARPAGPGPWTLPVEVWRALDSFARRLTRDPRDSMAETETVTMPPHRDLSARRWCWSRAPVDRSGRRILGLAVLDAPLTAPRGRAPALRHRTARHRAARAHRWGRPWRSRPAILRRCRRVAPVAHGRCAGCRARRINEIARPVPPRRVARDGHGHDAPGIAVQRPSRMRRRGAGHAGARTRAGPAGRRSRRTCRRGRP